MIAHVTIYMNWQNSARLVGNERLDLLWVDRMIRWTDIAEYWLQSFAYQRVGCTHEGKRRRDDLVRALNAH